MKEDWEINTKVYAILTKAWVDTRKIEVSTINQVIYIKGEIIFQRETSSLDPSNPLDELKLRAMDEEKLKKLEKDIKRITGIKDVKFELTNWIKVGSHWKYVIGRKRKVT